MRAALVTLILWTQTPPAEYPCQTYARVPEELSCQYLQAMYSGSRETLRILVKQGIIECRGERVERPCEPMKDVVEANCSWNPRVNLPALVTRYAARDMGCDTTEW